MCRESRNGPFADNDRPHVDAAFAQRVECLAVVASRNLDLGVGIGIAKPGQQVLEIGAVGAQLAMREAERGVAPQGGAASRRDGAGRDIEGVPRLHQKRDRKSTRLNSSHGYISYAVFCLKKKKRKEKMHSTEMR